MDLALYKVAINFRDMLFSGEARKYSMVHRYF